MIAFADTPVSLPRALRRWAALLLACVAVSCPAASSSTDWAKVGDEATQMLQQYLRINTSNPPGNEKAAAEFLRGILEREGLPVTVWEPAPGKANLLARVAGNGRKRPLILLHHMDVVPVARNFWSVDPFGGVIKDGYIWGRGALDTKGLGVAQIMAALVLKRQGILLDRDILLLATSDEEIGGVLGAGDVTRNHRDALLNAEFLLNEGARVMVDDNGKTLYHGVLVAEKAPFWLEVTARGTPGHGSMPRDDSAPNRLIRTLEKIRTLPPQLTVTPSVERYFRAIAPTMPPDLQPIYADIRRAIEDPAAREKLAKNLRNYALLRNTIAITVIEGSNKTNVIPPFARAELDVRLLPGQDPQAFLADLKKAVAGEGVDIKPLGIGWPPPEAQSDSALFSAITAVAQRREPGARIVPIVNGGFTDSHYFLELGITAYGFSPFRLNDAESMLLHGNDERLSLANLREGTRFMYDLIWEIGGGK